ncbi:hypothetical protein D9C73_007913 [Collichthys lucidus]|uniref:Uncharacterized protein n=1 Tax=Collichthys lucidus TaxID=240159 RepID=A0A4V6ANR1_COLLU|nr:hypothetical protein D9C73_007913 [Collichthys lucidus]
MEEPQQRQGKTLPRERLVPIVHRPLTTNGATAAATATDDQSSAVIRATKQDVETPCFMFGGPVETAA